MNTKYWIGLIIFSVVSAFAATLFTQYAWIGGAIMGLCYSAVYSLGKSEGKVK